MGIQLNNNLPAGSITQYAGNTEPAGWLLMYGQAISRTTYAALFLALGTAYGTGDGSTTFNLPDARGRVLFGKDNMGGTAANRLTTTGGLSANNTLGATGGGQTVTLTTAQMPSHAHLDGATFGAGNGTATIGPATANVKQVGTTGNTTAAAGTGGAHANIPPALVVNYIIKT